MFYYKNQEMLYVDPIRLSICITKYLYFYNFISIVAKDHYCNFLKLQKLE